MTRLYFGTWSLWALAPDVPMMLFLTPGNIPWRVKKDWYMYAMFYKVPHSLWALAFVPKAHRKIYAFHIVCDILSHTGQWSIQPFYPLDITIHGIWDPIDWN